MTASLLEAARQIGLPADALCERAGFSPTWLEDPDARVPLPLHFALWQALSEMPVGLELGAQMGLAGAGVVGYAMQHGATVGLSARTLHRRLQDEGIGFAQLVNDARKARALLLLEDPKLSVAEIAFLPGYAEPSAFFRAFRRWTGDTPRAFRQRLGARS